MDLFYIFKVLLKKIWILITVPLIAGIAAYLFTLDIEKQYKSTAQLSTGFTINNKVQITKENFDYWESRANFENLVEMMRSELVGSMLCYHLLIHDLTQEKSFRLNGPILSKISSDSIVSRLNKNLASFELLSSYDPFENEILKVLDEKKYDYAQWIKHGDLLIARINDTDFVKVEFRSENPFLSAFVVNKLCEEYIRYNNSLKNTVTEESLLFFASQVEKKKKDLDDKTVELNNFKNENQVYNYDQQSTSKLSQLAEYEIKLQEQENTVNGLLISLNSVKSRITNYDKSPSQVGASNNSKLLELKNKINELNKIYNEGGAKDKELENTLNDLRTQLQSELEKLNVPSDTDTKKPKTLKELIVQKEELELEYEIEYSNLQSIQDKVTSLRSNMSRIGSKESFIASLERERENTFKDYSSAVEKFNEAKSKSLITGSGVKLIIKGQPNADSESSKTLFLIALAIFGSGSLCCVVIILREYFDYSLKTPDKFERFSRIPLIGYIIQLNTSVSDVSLLFKQKTKLENVNVVTHLLRKIRFAVENSGKNVIIVSSTKIGEGKTFAISSLAHSLSLLNKRVLIIDTNFKHNSLTKTLITTPLLQRSSAYKLLNDPSHPEVDDDEVYSRNIVFHTKDKNVDIIGSKEGAESPSEIFAGKDFATMIDALKTNYDYIFLEGPALNDYSDTKELCQFADGVIVVFSAKSTLKQIDRESIKYIQLLNGKFMGAILNNVNSEDVRLSL